jgi:outer membrane lipoprotein
MEEGIKMAHSRFPRFLFFALFFFGIAGCGYPISQGLRGEARKDLTFPMVLQNPTAYIGSIVIWGGRIIETVNYSDRTELTVLESSLGYQGRPKGAKYSHGRFIAKSSKFLDPEIYQKGRKITLAGEIIGKETKPLGDLKYTYPVVMIKEIYPWEMERVYVPSPEYYWWGWDRYHPYDPYFWPYDDYLDYWDR